MHKIFLAYIHLISTFLDGYLSLILFESIVSRLVKERMKPGDDILISTIYVSTYNSAVLILSNLINSNPDSIDCFYLINIIRDNKKRIENKPKIEELERAINDFEFYLNDSKQFAERIKTIRDKRVGHVDRKIVNDPDAIKLDLPIKYRDMNEKYSTIRSHLQTIGNLIGEEANLSAPLALLDPPIEMLSKRGQILFQD